jgi:hypothetical protein
MLAGRNGARGRTCTCTVDVLDVVPLGGRLLRLGLREQNDWSLPPELHRTRSLTERMHR